MDSSAFPEYYDILVVGGGSTGAIIAARLSEDSRRRVLLLEAGPGVPADKTMAQAIRNANQVAVVPGLNWKISTAIKGELPPFGKSPTKHSTAGTFDYEAGRILGGSSAINAVQALRGAPTDFDEWAKDCGSDWSWEKVLPYFRALEDDPIGSDSLHGRGGPMPIRRERKEDLTPLQAGLMGACLANGFSQTDDHNDPETTGVGVVPKNAIEGVRMSTALTYLEPAKQRPNLHIVTGVHIHRLIWEKPGRCKGVEADIGGLLQSYSSHHVILCAGAMGTPIILMRSGIGSPALLEPLGIAVRSPLTGVGDNLMDHPVVGIWGLPRSGASTLGEPLRQTLLRYTSSHSGYENDMHICMMAGLNVKDMFPTRASTSGLSTIAGLTVCFNKSTSRGSIRITSVDPHARPLASLNCLGEPSDTPPLMEGVRLAWRLLHHSSLRYRFESILAWTEGMIHSDIALKRAITAFVRPGAHICGSAKMGSSPDAGAVANAQGLVYGTNNVWIGDASIMPRIPSAPPHLTSLMIAEKIASEFRKKH